MGLYRTERSDILPFLPSWHVVFHFRNRKCVMSTSLILMYALWMPLNSAVILSVLVKSQFFVRPARTARQYVIVHAGYMNYIRFSLSNGFKRRQCSFVLRSNQTEVFLVTMVRLGNSVALAGFSRPKMMMIQYGGERLMTLK